MKHHVFKISDAASLALHTTVLLASEPNRHWSTPEVASTLQVSAAHLAKVLQWLTKAGLVRSIRGPKGGFLLARPPSEVTLLQVYEAIEGPVEPPHCLLGAPACRLRTCMLGELADDIDTRVRAFLGSARLSDVAASHALDLGTHAARPPDSA